MKTITPDCTCEFEGCALEGEYLVQGPKIWRKGLGGSEILYDYTEVSRYCAKHAKQVYGEHYFDEDRHPARCPNCECLFQTGKIVDLVFQNNPK